MIPGGEEPLAGTVSVPPAFQVGAITACLIAATGLREAVAPWRRDAQCTLTDKADHLTMKRKEGK